MLHVYVCVLYVWMDVLGANHLILDTQIFSGGYSVLEDMSCS